MQKELAGFVSVLALMAGAAIAQDSTGGATTTGQPPATGEPPAAEEPAPTPAPDTGATTGGESAQTEQPATGEETTTAQDEPASSGTKVSVDEMVGRDVIGADGQPLGSVADVIVDPETGEVQQLVIASGGFLGIGEKQVAVDMAEAEIRPNEGIFLSSVTQADIESMPEFNAAEETESLEAPAPAPTTGGGGMTPAPAPAPQ